jgi:hypothetical protein
MASIRLRALAGAVCAAAALWPSAPAAGSGNAPKCSASLSPGEAPGSAIEPGETARGTLVCRDDEADPLTYTVVQPPSRGTLTPIEGDRVGPPTQRYVALAYTAGSDTGPDSFQLRANDGTQDSNLVTVNLEIFATRNDAPYCWGGMDMSFPWANEVEQGDSAPGTVYCSEDEGDPLTFSTVQPPVRGTLSGFALAAADDSPTYRWAKFTYTAGTATTGDDSFQVRAHDGAQDSNTVTIGLNVVAARDDAPSGTSDSPAASPTAVPATTAPPPPATTAALPPAARPANSHLARCSRLRGPARTRCVALARALVKCDRLRGARKTRCVRRARALSRCATLTPAKRLRCVRAANRLGVAPARRP